MGDARRTVAQLCRETGLSKEFSARVSLVTTELARNLAIHTPGGEILAKVLENSPEPGVEIMALDTGPGIRNIGESLRDGHSTAGTAGNGFGCIRRLSQQFEIFSQLNAGTAVLVRLYTDKIPAREAFEVGGVSIAVDGETLCGDAWDYKNLADGLRMTMVDGLGHGYFAHEAAMRAKELFRQKLHAPQEDLMRSLDDELRGTRGAVLALARVDLAAETVYSVGVGNISMRLLNDSGTRSMISENGTLGAGARRIREYSYPWSRDSILVMHSDGVSANWSLDRYPGLSLRHPSLIAGIIYRDQHRERDDATIAVARQAS